MIAGKNVFFERRQFMLSRTIYVAVDGFDGTGKSSLISNLISKTHSHMFTSTVERLLPITVKLFKEYSNGTNDYMKSIPNRFRVSAYLWESYLRLKLRDEEYKKYDFVFFDRWIFTNLVNSIDFGEDASIIKFLVASVPRPDVLFLIKTSPENIFDHLRSKNDWMLSYYKDDEISSHITQFYQGYEEQLQKHDLNYILLNGDKPLEQMAEYAYGKLIELGAIKNERAKNCLHRNNG